MIIKSKKVWIASQFIPAAIEVVDGKIERIYEYDEKEADIDYGNKKIVPGFIDIHTHGAYGFDTNDAEEEGLRNWTKNIVEEGVTGILATTITQSHTVLSNALKNVAKVVKNGYEGARILGVHFEGPYLDMVYKGAQPEEHIIKGTIEEFEQYQKDAEGLIKYITLAPEHDKNFELTRHLVKNGVVVSMGHSGATFEQAQMAVANGVKSMTHIYNGMSPFNHRKIGLVGSAFRIKNIFGEAICDCNHSTPEALNILFQLKGRDKVVMVSDGLMAKGFAVGTKFLFGGNEIEIYPDGSAHLTKSKSLAGSTMKMNEGLRNLIEYCDVDVEAAINSCTINPATLLGLDDHIGKICTGYDADLVVLNDDYSVVQTYVKGLAQLEK